MGILPFACSDPVELARAVDPLRSEGIRIALDDFGAPGGSITALVELQPDVVKVDRALVRGIADSIKKQRLFEHLMGFMDGGTWLIAEGVESEDDCDALRRIGVPYSQGYLWSPPQPLHLLKPPQTS
ncbi:MAG: EAL domain-containing protein [Thermoflavifilum sp.]|nr:EAL domain-containing protein [Thermoflavifilum sp.]MCL6514824.1 EAL domain-containing protein [Alicyclobacillus sp.]